MNKKDICKKILETYGTSKQMEQTKEELLELGLALRHFATGKVGMKEVITEIADVKIMAEQMAIAFGRDDVEMEVERKLQRQMERMAGEKPDIEICPHSTKSKSYVEKGLTGWDEEDEKMLDKCKHFIAIAPVGWNMEEGQKAYDCGQWLKSLPQKLSLLPKREWCDEDEKMYNKLMDDIYYSGCMDAEDFWSAFTEIREWVLSRMNRLRPQSN